MTASKASEPEFPWALETMLAINRLTPEIKGKAFDPDWCLLRCRLEEYERLHIAATARAAEAEAKYQETLKQEHDLSDSYVTVREIIGAIEGAPGMRLEPPEILWRWVEQKARDLVAALSAAELDAGRLRRVLQYIAAEAHDQPAHEYAATVLRRSAP